MAEKKEYVWRPPKELWDNLSKQAEKDGISLNAFLNLKLKKFQTKR